MRLILMGYGKMGRMVEKVAGDNGHQIVHKIDPLTGSSEIEGEWLEQADAIVDFSVGSAVLPHVAAAVQGQIPIVVGTTGWGDDLEQVRATVEQAQGACVHSSNFSTGVQALFYLTKLAGKLMSRFQDVHPFIRESHHVQKVDAPSGTAISLQRLLEESYDSDVPVSSVRAGYFPGEHVVGFDSPVDTLTLQHSARGREGFARGALFAAEWIQGKKGFFSFEEILFGDLDD